MKLFFQRYFELAFWAGSLLSLGLMDPGADVHYSFCFFKWIGIHFCPGCGLGHAVSFLFHGDIRSSFEAHPLGLFALIIILFRIYQLSSLHIYNQFKKNNHAIR